MKNILYYITFSIKGSIYLCKEGWSFSYHWLAGRIYYLGSYIYIHIYIYIFIIWVHIYTYIYIYVLYIYKTFDDIKDRIFKYNFLNI